MNIIEIFILAAEEAARSEQPKNIRKKQALDAYEEYQIAQADKEVWE